MNVKFYELALGAVFQFRGTRYQKLAMGLAWDEKRRGNIFMGETEVVSEGEPKLLSAEEAAKWKPAERHWTDRLGLAPGQ